MADLWIPAATALALVAGPAKNTYEARGAICKRAHYGLFGAKCALFTFGTTRKDNADVPAGFWWADGHEALEQDWKIGDFKTWIDQKFECRAFGVTFALEGLLAMVPPERRGPLRRAVSVAGAADWVSAIQTLRLIQERTGLPAHEAEKFLIQQARLGFVPARAVLMSAWPDSAGEPADSAREWDVPDYFWAALKPDADWNLGAFSAHIDLNGPHTVTAESVHFALPALDEVIPLGSRQLMSTAGAPKIEPNGGQKGRPPAAYWDELWCSIWGDIFRGDLQPKSQADVQGAMLNCWKLMGIALVRAPLNCARGGSFWRFRGRAESPFPNNSRPF